MRLVHRIGTHEYQHAKIGLQLLSSERYLAPGCFLGGIKISIINYVAHHFIGEKKARKHSMLCSLTIARPKKSVQCLSAAQHSLVSSPTDPPCQFQKYLQQLLSLQLSHNAFSSVCRYTPLAVFSCVSQWKLPTQLHHFHCPFHFEDNKAVLKNILRHYHLRWHFQGPEGWKKDHGPLL